MKGTRDAYQVTAPDASKPPQPPEIERLTMTGLLEPFGLDLDALELEGAVGDISYNMFNHAGRGSPEWQFFITAGNGFESSGVDFYRNLATRGRIVMVMAGWNKKVALLPAMRHGLFNVLITDAYTAERCLEDEKKQLLRMDIPRRVALPSSSSGR